MRRAYVRKIAARLWRAGILTRAAVGFHLSRTATERERQALEIVRELIGEQDRKYFDELIDLTK